MLISSKFYSSPVFSNQLQVLMLLFCFLFLFLFLQVLEAHPTYPKIRKDILDKARTSLRP